MTASIARPRSRIAAWTLDAAIAGIVFTPFLLLLGIGVDHLAPGISTTWLVPVVVLVFPYMVVFDGGKRGATPGKRLIGIRVADQKTGGPIGYRRAAIRRLVYFVGGWLLFIGWLSGLRDPLRQTWHDKAAASVVVRARDREQLTSSVAPA